MYSSIFSSWSIGWLAHWLVCYFVRLIAIGTCCVLWMEYARYKTTKLNRVVIDRFIDFWIFWFDLIWLIVSRRMKRPIETATVQSSSNGKVRYGTVLASDRIVCTVRYSDCTTSYRIVSCRVVSCRVVRFLSFRNRLVVAKATQVGIYYRISS